MDKMKRLPKAMLAILHEYHFIHLGGLIEFSGVNIPRKDWGSFTESYFAVFVSWCGQLWVGPRTSDKKTLLDKLGQFNPKAIVMREAVLNDWDYNLFGQRVGLGQIIERAEDPYGDIDGTLPADELDEPPFEEVLDREVFGAPLEEVALDARDEEGKKLKQEEEIRIPRVPIDPYQPTCDTGNGPELVQPMWGSRPLGDPGFPKGNPDPTGHRRKPKE